MLRKSLLAALSPGRVLVGDGAWGTELLKRGLALGACPEQRCLTRPEEIRGLAASYAAAGADLVETNSFGANRFRLEAYGLGEKVAQLNEAAARLGREALDAGPASGRKLLLLGSMGPSGLKRGQASPEVLREAFALQAEALARGGVDALCLETMMDAREASIALRAAKEATGLEAICSFSFVLCPDGSARTIAGESLREAVEAALGSGAEVVGANCGSGFEEMLVVLGLLRSALGEADSGAPIMVSPNAGLPAPAASRAVGGRAPLLAYPGTPELMADFARRAVAAGASIVGGCCGTGPEHVAAIRRAVDAGERGA
jgi:5-methyltetrahydrofolate--homocysteine methyltransferase